MVRSILAATLVIATTSAALAQSYKPDFNPTAMKVRPPARSGELLILGSPHLANFPETFSLTNLDLVLSRLAAWEPEAVAIETVSGPQCVFMRQYPDRYADSVDAYCIDTAAAMTATGLTVPEATREAALLLKRWPTSPTGAQRRRLAALFMASGDEASAMVQWLRLPDIDQREGSGLDATLVARLVRWTTRRDESIAIGAQLAARLGLERVFPIDDHTADSVVDDEAGYEAAMARAWDNPANHKRQANEKALAADIGTPAGVLRTYRAYNARGSAKIVFDSDFGAALRDPSPQAFGRQYVAYWETRNLRMAANIRDMMQEKPGERALLIVGASHKGYLEAYLNQMHDLAIKDADLVLR